MDTEGLRKYLADRSQGALQPPSIWAVTSRCRRIERTTGVDLDSVSAAEIGTKLQLISTDKRVLANLRHALRCYQEFRQASASDRARLS